MIEVVSYIDILRLPIFQELGNNTAKNIISKPEVTIIQVEKISIVVNKFKKFGVFSISVVENEQIMGIVRLHELINTIIGFKRKPEYGTVIGEKPNILDLPVENIMTDVTVSASRETTISNVIEKMIENELDSLPIIEDDNLLGIVTIKELLKLVTSFEDYVYSFTTVAPPPEPINVISVTPANGVAKVKWNTTVIITFDTAIDQNSFKTAFVISPTEAISKYECSTDNKTVTITFSEDLEFDKLYTCTIKKADLKPQTGLKTLAQDYS